MADETQVTTEQVAEAVQAAREAIKGKPKEVQRKVVDALIGTHQQWQQPKVSEAMLALLQEPAQS